MASQTPLRCAEGMAVAASSSSPVVIRLSSSAHISTDPSTMLSMITTEIARNKVIANPGAESFFLRVIV